VIGDDAYPTQRRLVAKYISLFVQGFVDTIYG